MEIDPTTNTNNSDQSQIKLRNKFLNSTSFEGMINLIGNNLEGKSAKILDNIISDNLQNFDSNLNQISIDKPENSIFYNIIESSNIKDKKTHITNFVLSFFSTLTNSNDNHILHMILGKPKFLQEVFSIISLYAKLKKNGLIDLTREIHKSALEILFDANLNFIFWKEFIEIFKLGDLIFKQDFNELNDNSDYSLITTHINNSIESMIKQKSKKMEHLLKIIEYLKEYCDSINNNTHLIKINSKSLFDYFLTDKSLLHFLKKLLKIFPLEAEKIINFYLTMNDTKSINSILKDINIDELDPKIKEDIILKSQCKAINFHYNRYYNYEIDFQQLIELTDKNKSVISYLVEMCCRDKLYAESYHLLKIHDFNLDEINIEKSSIKNLHEFLLNLKCDKNLNKKANYPNIPGDKKKKKTDINSESLDRNCENNFSILDIDSNLDCNKTTYKEFLKSFLTNKKLEIKCEDYFAPFEYHCIKLPMKSKDILFIDDYEKLKKIQELSLLDKKYQYIGFDAEWKSTTSPFEIDNGAAIIQLATKNKVFIFDVIKLNYLQSEKLKEFTKLFNEIFNEKILIGFSHRNDFNNIKNIKLKKCLTRLKSFDFVDLYEKKYQTKCPSLKKVCIELLNKDLCKYEQISNWEIRPLRLRQLHYAALDAYVLLNLFEMVY